MIKFDHVSKKFGKTQVFHDLSFEILDKEFVFLVGKSGCGKTTIFRLLNKEYLPSSGKISVDGVDVQKLPRSKIFAHRRKLGIVFQDLKLLLDRTVFENVSLSLLIRGESNREIEKKVKQILNFVSLTGKENLFPKELSGGEVQRVSIARAVIADPEIVLADEPTADLDQATSWEIVQLLKTLNDNGKTVIVATHNYDIVNSLKKRVILLDNGKIVSDGVGEKLKI